MSSASFIPGITFPVTTGLGSSGCDSNPTSGSHEHFIALVTPNLYQCAFVIPRWICPNGNSLPFFDCFESFLLLFDEKSDGTPTSNRTEEWSVSAPLLPNRNTADTAFIDVTSSTSLSSLKKEEEVVMTLIVDNGELDGRIVFNQSEFTYYNYQ